jgi:hypothetical protein
LHKRNLTTGVFPMSERAEDGIRLQPLNGYRLRHMLASSLVGFSWFIALPVLSAATDPPDTPRSQEGWKNLGNGILQDERTKLEWSQSDNGADIDWNEAKASCDGKHAQWRLPSLQELKSIYNEHARGVRCANATCKVASQFHLTGSWFWSATQVGKDATDGIELAWGVLLVNGAQTQTVREASYGSRALCVRDIP